MNALVPCSFMVADWKKTSNEHRGHNFKNGVMPLNKNIHKICCITIVFELMHVYTYA